MAKIKGVISLYNGIIPEMRDEGHAFASIGRYTGVSRERIRQIFKKYYPKNKPDGMSETELAGYLKVDGSRLSKMRKEGKINPIQLGNIYFYNYEEIIKATKCIKLRACKHCGVVGIPTKNHSYCSKCAHEMRRYNYPFLSRKAKKRASECGQRWRDDNPDRVKVINAKAMARYYEKKKLERLKNTIYQIRMNGYELPKGIMVKAIGYKKGFIIFDGGVAVKVFDVNKVQI